MTLLRGLLATAILCSLVAMTAAAQRRPTPAKNASRHSIEKREAKREAARRTAVRKQRVKERRVQVRRQKRPIYN